MILTPRTYPTGTSIDLWDNPFQLEFSLVCHLSMSSRTRGQRVNKNGGKDKAERVFKLLLSVVNLAQSNPSAERNIYMQRSPR